MALIAQATVIHLGLYGITAQSVTAVDTDGDVTTQEWLVQEVSGLYRLACVTETGVVLTRPFHPHGDGPWLMPPPAVPVQRVGTRDVFVELNPATQVLTITSLPSCR